MPSYRAPYSASSSLTTRAPISVVPTSVVPGVWMSRVRQPAASTRSRLWAWKIRSMTRVCGCSCPASRAVKVAVARHHQVMLVLPWPKGVPLPEKDDAMLVPGEQSEVRRRWQEAFTSGTARPYSAPHWPSG